MTQQKEEWIIHDEPPQIALSDCLRRGQELDANLRDLDSIITKAHSSPGTEFLGQAVSSLMRMFMEMRIASLEEKLETTQARVSRLETEVAQATFANSLLAPKTEWREDALEELVGISQSVPRKYSTKEAFEKWQSQE